MKTGILTYQNTLNFGAALQCYALYRSIELMDIDVEIIDYRNTKIANSTRPISIATNRGRDKLSLRLLIKSSLLYPFVKSKQKAFDDFNKKHIKYSKKTYRSNDEIKHSMPTYDKYIIGSDQLWNYNINGLDTTYFMDFVDDKSKVFTYATSFGLSHIEKDKSPIYEAHLSELKNVSVREKKGAEIIKDLLGTEVNVVADPVLLLTENEWLSLIHNNYEYKNNQIVSYFLNYNTRSEFEKMLKSDKKVDDFKLIKLAGGISPRDFVDQNTIVNLSNGPIDFMRYIKESKMIFTDSFHATVFSILFKKKFVVFLSGNAGRDSRIIDLLNQYGLEDHIFNSDCNINQKINEDKINKINKLNREEGINFLKSYLSSNFSL